MLTQALLKKSMPKALGHITSLKQLTELQLTPAPAGGSRPVDSTSFQPGNDAPFICPITDLPLNGRFRAFVLQPSGLVVSERAIKEVSINLHLASGLYCKKALSEQQSALQQIPLVCQGLGLRHYQCTHA